MFQTAMYSDRGGRSCNEDSVRQCYSGDGALCLVLADGLGGHGGGDLASTQACRVVCEKWSGRVSLAALNVVIQSAHRSIHDIQRPDCAMKSTVVTLLLEPEKAVWAHVGDSRLYHFVDGALVFQTRDHSASQIAVLLGDITPDQIRFHEDRSRVLRALGQEGALNVESGETELGPGQHAFLLCSDGFWEYVLEAEMEQALRDADSPQDWLDRMRALLTTRIPADNDNNTAAVVWL